jgi:hypothetical protein
LEAAHLDISAKKLGARIIAADRPAVRLELTGTVLDHAKDIELPADYLQPKEYGVLGVGGGGPYALACAALPASTNAESRRRGSRHGCTRSE